MLIKKQLEELRDEVYDLFVQRLKEKNPLEYTQEEKDKIARFQLKYYLSSTKCSAIFGLDRTTFSRYCNSLAERNMIFAEKMLLYNNFYQAASQKWLEKNNDSIISRGGSK